MTLGQVCHEFANCEASDSGLLQRLGNLPSRYECFSSIFLLSEAARVDFCAIYPEEAAKTVLIPHGPELLFEPEGDAATKVAAHYGLRDGQRIVLMFGGLRPSKGVPELVEAFALLREAPDTRLIIAGYPSKEFDADALVAQIAALGLTDRVTIDFRYLPMGELGALIERADVVVFPYRSATSSGALALAQSSAGRSSRRPSAGSSMRCVTGTPVSSSPRAKRRRWRPPSSGSSMIPRRRRRSGRGPMPRSPENAPGRRSHA